MVILSVLFFLMVSAKESGNDNPGVSFEKLTQTAVPNLRQKQKEAKIFCVKNQMNTDFCILIDLSIHSGENRFFVVDFKKDSIVQQALVSHGCANFPWAGTYSKENAVVSNVDGSHASSTGHYRIGTRGVSQWGVGVKYALQGLEATNSNALKRLIVFHSWDMVADSEVFPAGTPEGWGCPAISNKVFLKVDSLLKGSKKDVMMWIFR